MNRNKPASTTLQFDTRMVEWNLKHEIVNKDQLNQFLKSLPDEAANATTLNLDEESAATSAVASGDVHTNGSGN